MNDWTPARLGDLIDIKHGYAFKGEYFREAPPGQILLTPGNFAIGGGFQFGKVKYYAGPQAPDYILSAGDLLVTMTDLSKAGDTLGYPAIVPADDNVYLHNQRLGKVLLRSADVEQDFIYWLLRTNDYRAEVLASCTGSTVKHTSPGRIQAFRFLLPPREQRQRICEALNSLDDKIELNRRINETLEAMAQAIFRDWFVDFGPTLRKLDGATDPLTIMGGLVQDSGRAQALADLFPAAFGGDGLPEGWNAGRLDELAEVHMGASPKGDTYNEDGVGTPLANGPVEFGDYFLVEKKWTTSPTRLSQVGDFVICVRGSTTGRHVFADGAYCLGRGVAALRGLPGEQDFVNATIIMHLDTLLQKTTGSVFPNLSGDDIRSFSCLVPPKAVRRQFSLLAEPLRMRIWHNIHENRTLAASRDLLLPKLMSGEIRLSEAEDLMEAAQ
ncbi:restriction endonuclease subunit S [Rhizobium redzepovicii]|uniref:restriction endonuclease subunit S n=1 Tax=Rhizobium redzepovicii TaxID=2867518 RepID=UPI00287226CA|nr:restriction endonuclease subunit S [Rhizobium redzepovicii]MDR9779589.1 restriction endonuclease subunit S [Rhizobium redzepovicii]